MSKVTKPPFLKVVSDNDSEDKSFKEKRSKQQLPKDGKLKRETDATDDEVQEMIVEGLSGSINLILDKEGARQLKAVADDKEAYQKKLEELQAEISETNSPKQNIAYYVALGLSLLFIIFIFAINFLHWGVQ